MGREALDYWLAIGMIDGLGLRGINRLLESCGDPEKIFGLSLTELVKRHGLRQEIALAISSFAGWGKIAEEREKAERSGIKIIPRFDEQYPKKLLNIYDPPPILYAKGNLAVLNLPAVAIVGSRKASIHGRNFAAKIAGNLAEQGVAVISGMAIGIDGFAHEGCLSKGGKTIAVWGSGLDVCYPSRHRNLAERIVIDGLLISEFPLGAKPEKQNFPRRNRLISGLAVGVLVVEASLKSGSLLTARFALEQGREVFAVPGLPASPESSGSNWLLKEGARLVENVDDIFFCLPELAGKLNFKPVISDFSPGESSTYSEEQQMLLELMGGTIHDQDELQTMTSWPHDKLSRVLLELELMDVVWRIGPGRFQVKNFPR